MLDSTELEKRGIPTVTIATKWFVTAAHVQAAMAGVPDLRVVGMNYVGRGQGHWMSREDREALIDHHWVEILAALIDDSNGRAG